MITSMISLQDVAGKTSPLLTLDRDCHQQVIIEDEDHTPQRVLFDIYTYQQLTKPTQVGQLET